MRVRSHHLSLLRGLVPLGVAALLLGGCIHVSTPVIEPEIAATSRLNRSLSDPDLRAFLSQHSAGATWDFERLCWVAFYERADLAVTRAQWAAVVAASRGAAERPNPTVAVNPGYNVNSGDQSPWFPSIDFDIPITGSGKRAADQTRAMHEAEARRQDVLVAAWRVRSELWSALAAEAAARQRVQAWSALVVADEKIAALWQQRVSAGESTSSQLGAARLAQARDQSQLVAAQQDVVQTRQTVAAALGLPVAALADVELPEPSVARMGTREDALRERADVRAALADYAAAQEALRLELARQYPDLHLGPGYQWDQGASKWSLVVSFEWPVFSRNAAAIGTAVGQRELAAARFEAVQAQALADIEQEQAALTAAEARHAALMASRDAERSQLERIQTRVTAGESDRLELAAAQRDALATQLTLIDATAAATAARGALAAALQVPFAHADDLIAIQLESSRP